MKEFVFSLCAALSLLACGSKPSDAKPPVPAASVASPSVTTAPAAKPAQEPLLVPAPTAIETLGGWLTLGTPASVVAQKLGAPEKGEKVYQGATGTYVQKWRYADLGLVLQMEAEQEEGPQEVGSAGITLVHPGTLQTEQKIGIGSSAEDVRDRYAQLVDSDASNAETIVVGSPYEGTVFSIQRGVVRKIFIGAAAE